MTLPRIVGLAGVAIFLIYVLPNAKSDEVLSPAAQRGFVPLKTNCSRCHAVGNRLIQSDSIICPSAVAIRRFGTSKRVGSIKA
jgi:hypothetical protein